MTRNDCVIVGAGQAGTTAAMELRRRGFDGRIVLIGDERHLPYERPPLSKDVLVKPGAAHVTMFPSSFYDEQRIELRLGTRVVAIDPGRHAVTLADDTTLEFGRLLLATGARARRLPMLDRLGDGVYTLRTLDDARALTCTLRAGRRLLIVGGGVIGMELASSAVELGVHATVIEQAHDVMERCAPSIVRQHLRALHVSRGVDVLTGRRVVRAARDSGDFVLALDDDTELRGDAIVYGIGVEPDVALARAAGLRTDGAILVDAACRTSHPDVFAAGDSVAQQYGPGEPAVRGETWDNANRQAACAAAAMLGMSHDASHVPWFWTDQCGVNVQFAGDVAAEAWVVRGNLAASSCVLFGLRDGVVTGGVTLNRGQDMRSVRTLIKRCARIGPNLLRDPAQDLRALAKVSELSGA
ncbi:3-phenylpropionate/cinnamic acid dioxygenase ferredoxin--NAD(+) reductase subunit [Burkholderia diffusa]|uniref:3-phenylpropionate/cinnamic acid dioxygenase ferredoxin--NAD(+) reductase subunit n=1 Tax=Burkholderia diffusa TaxID=488732 RepID=UPI000841E5F7|nr:3-phenylpropionate/cinnamic acid dioxygenase ferredoxin--NAD(+) reductase subunit [Burkholderia diffusa]AOI61937.1 pyridine nucleotide-disulfide oxidoreductase [Burkholderia diffusa]